MKITVIGSGYVGLVTGACLADLGNYVYCLDLNQDKVDLLNQGEVPIYEPGLKELITLNKNEGRLKFGTDVKEATAFGDIQFIAVGTGVIYRNHRCITEFIQTGIAAGDIDPVQQIIDDPHQKTRILNITF